MTSIVALYGSKFCSPIVACGRTGRMITSPLMPDSLSLAAIALVATITVASGMPPALEYIKLTERSVSPTMRGATECMANLLSHGFFR
jgi:hypothetical protein